MEPDRKYWCISGEGHAHPEDHPRQTRQVERKDEFMGMGHGKDQSRAGRSRRQPLASMRVYLVWNYVFMRAYNLWI